MATTGETIRAILLRVPRGRATSYGTVAAMAGLPNGARTVARILHSCSAADGLPWWRVVRADGGIALGRGAGFEEQRAALAEEGVEVGADGRVDLRTYGWPGN
ncbi:MAG: MGMT family protein [Spirochaetes bacterium]|nr:MGMT family protein [Spirochaetota bacterium]MBU1081573.1 MGMT family protein [Spirochaetota bacterium]